VKTEKREILQQRSHRPVYRKELGKQSKHVMHVVTCIHNRKVTFSSLAYNLDLLTWPRYRSRWTACQISRSKV